MNRKRLFILAKHLENIKAKHFNLDEWCEIDGGEIIKGRIAKVGCDTTGCAIGWASTVPSFHRDGFKIEINSCGLAIPVFKSCDSWAAVEKFFALKWTEAEWLFHPDKYTHLELKRPLAVARRIRSFLNGKTPPPITFCQDTPSR